MEVRAKKYLGQHFLTDQDAAMKIVNALIIEEREEIEKGEEKEEGEEEKKECKQRGDAENTEKKQANVLEIGPGMGVLTQYLLQRDEIFLKAVEIDDESVEYLLKNFPELRGRILEEDFLKMNLNKAFATQNNEEEINIIGNFPYNISSQIFFKILEHKNQVPQVVCMIQKEVAERIAEKPGTKTYGILSVLLQAWYDIDYLFTVGPGAFAPPPKVQSAVIRLTRNSRQSLNCDETKFKMVVKTAFNQRRKTLRNSLKTLILDKGLNSNEFEVFNLRPERLGVEDFVNLTNLLFSDDPKVIEEAKNRQATTSKKNKKNKKIKKSREDIDWQLI